MEVTAQKSIERVVSQRALQMSNSSPCKICVVGFLFGACFTYFFLAVLTPSRTFEFGVLFPTPSVTALKNSSSSDINTSGSGDCGSVPKEIGGAVDDERVSLLYSAWSAKLNRSKDGEEEFLNHSSLPDAPHLENCELTVQVNQQLDSHGENGSFPSWSIWKGSLGLSLTTDGEQRDSRHQPQHEEAYPPWIVGSDEDNIPFTRQVQHDIWVHQHPSNCSDPQVRFLVADWERLPGFGMGGQFAGMCGLLAIAINEKRVLVTNYYNRADHDGCQGSSRSRWSCYFFPETSAECRDRAFELVARQDAWENGIVTGKENYTSKQIWAGRIPRMWGSPWNNLQPTTEIDGTLVTHHRKMDRRWWRAQEVVNKPQADIERLVWSNHKPWIPRPLLSMHVRMGDKASEMKVVGFEEYMRLADRIRRRFPDLNCIWLSTEMQEVIDKTRLYPHWNFYFTNITRQVGNTTMATYEASLGRETSTNYPLVNFLMATDANFFIGALGSTWCFLIDGMRNTGGKVMAGYLSVNRDRFW
ncbi:uncharacterized protein LOC131240445 isoform X2 [Magnolia sinica]|uniref:uncharacterized protein LOC131240445 isoform X2 n=1 Tax=Magnolia sinica TaxID=86752 RepID=UPI0026582953|nr:uncharacterized protein LOC131240445 isoform X2 [Magnolia sinica]